MSNMVNFRADPKEIAAIDRAAEQLGMNRSDFIRQAIKQYIQQAPEVAVSVRTSRNGQCIEGKAIRDCTVKLMQKNAAGVQQCMVCGKKGR